MTDLFEAHYYKNSVQQNYLWKESQRFYFLILEKFLWNTGNARGKKSTFFSGRFEMT